MSKTPLSLFIVIVIVVVFSRIAIAQTQIDVNFPGGTNPTTEPGGIIANFYQFALMVGGVLAFGVIVYGGIKYTLAAGNPSGQSDGKEWIKGALLGLLLLVGAYLILNTINPNLTNLKLPTLEQIQAPAPGGGGGVGGGLTDAQARAQLTAAGIGIKPGVSLEGMRQSTVHALKSLKSSCNCEVYVTSGTDSHSSGTCGHSGGYKADIRPNDSLNNYITGGGCAAVGKRGDDRASLYACPGGSVIADERNIPGRAPHWDLSAGHC